MKSKHVLLLAGALVFGPPCCLALIGACTLFMYLTEPWGWFLLFLLLGLPVGTVVVGLIIRYGGRHERGGFEPSARHPGWKAND